MMTSRSNVRVDNAPLNIRGTRKGIIQLCLLGRELRVPKGEKTPKRVHWIGVDDWIGYTIIIIFCISWIDNEGKSNARFHPGQYAFPSSVPGKCYGRDVKVLSSFEWNNGQLQQLREGSPGIWEMVIFWKVLLLLMCRLIIVMLLLWLHWHYITTHWQRQEETRHNAIKVSMDSELNGLWSCKRVVL